MNLHQLVTGAISTVNPPTTVVFSASTGYAIGADGTQVPSYAAPVSVQAQVQALTTDDLFKLDQMNLQGARQSLYISGHWYAAIRVSEKGGDLLTFNGDNWLVVAVMEQWDTWCRLAVALQNGS